MPEDKIRKVLKIAKEPISMETPIGEDEDASIGDLIEDITTIALPVDEATKHNLTESTRGVLGSLTAREAKVSAHALWYRYEHRSHAGRGRQTV